MLDRTHFAVLLLILWAATALGQGPSAGEMRVSSSGASRTLDAPSMDQWMTRLDGRKRREELSSSTDSVSQLDLVAPKEARQEYDKGLLLLMQDHLKEGVQHLTKSISLYPNFVAAHTALGSAYLDLGQNELARAEFAQALSLDDHLPYSYMNLGRAELALQNYPAAEESIQKASSIAPLDLHLLTALAYTQLLNRHYDAVIDTVHQVHGRDHDGAAIVHYFGATAWQAQNNPQESRGEFQALFEEDPKSPAAEQARQIMAQAAQGGNAAPDTSAGLSHATFLDGKLSALDVPAPQPQSPPLVAAIKAENPVNRAKRSAISDSEHEGWTMRSSVDEVDLFFAATDQGKSVSDLVPANVTIRDAGNPPAAISGFRRESQLPLRLGLVIDTSGSIKSRFDFELDAAANFLKQILTGKDDLAFVVGFANSTLMVQDFTADQKQISHRIGQLAPAGGTAAWDAVSFAAQKLASLPETQPVARMLVVISDGEDNCSKTTLRNAIKTAEQGGVAVYVVSTREDSHEAMAASDGDRDLKLLAARTGGAAFFPGYIEHLTQSLTELQEVIRSRYLISYKPDSFKRDGRYRSIDITARKSGHKLRVFARKGYFAPTNSIAKENN